MHLTVKKQLPTLMRTVLKQLLGQAADFAEAADKLEAAFGSATDCVEAASSAGC